MDKLYEEIALLKEQHLTLQSEVKLLKKKLHENDITLQNCIFLNKIELIYDASKVQAARNKIREYDFKNSSRYIELMNIYKKDPLNKRSFMERSNDAELQLYKDKEKFLNNLKISLGNQTLSEIIDRLAKD